MMEGGESDLMCFKMFNFNEFTARFREKSTEVEVILTIIKKQIFKFIDTLINESLNNNRTQ